MFNTKSFSKKPKGVTTLSLNVQDDGQMMDKQLEDEAEEEARLRHRHHHRRSPHSHSTGAR